MCDRLWILMLLLLANFELSCANKNDANFDIQEKACSELSTEQVNRIKFETTVNLVIYYPQFTSIDLACGTAPDEKDTSIIYCAEAAFTGQKLDDFKHSNVAGNHVSGGKYYRGFTCRPNTGTFVWYDGKWKFLMNNHEKELKLAAQKGGMGFRQNMIIFNHKTQPSFRKLTSKFEYRALCEYKGKLCIIDSKKVISYQNFIASLEKLNVKHALYLDMGTGWNYSWYRENNGRVYNIHPKRHHYITNWIVFKK